MILRHGVKAALGWALLATGLPAFGALTFPGCADPVAADFKAVDLVSRDTTANALVKDPTLLEPLSMYIHSSGRVYWTERTTTGSGTASGATSAVGRIRVFNPAGNTVKTVQSFNISTAANPQGQGNPEYGLRNFTLDPDYANNKFAYVVYNPRTTVSGRNVDTLLLSRFTMPTLDTLDLSTEKKLLRMPFTIGICCHEGGAMDWDAQGNLYVSIGNNTENQQTGDVGPLYMDDTLLGSTGENKDRATRDNQARAANTMDYRGKILRIKPDNSAKGYSIPSGNYWQKYFEIGGAWVAGQDTTRILKEIYVVGDRSPWTLHVDRPTGWLVFGDVGPDNGSVVNGRGPVARDEWDLVKGPGFFGFPYFLGHQQGLNMWNPATNTYSLPVQNPDSVYNNSPNNTGVAKLTRAMPPLLATCHNTAGQSCDGNLNNYALNTTASGAAAASGPIYRYDNGLASAKKLPPHFNGKWIINDGVRHWVKLATLSAGGDSVIAVDDWPGYAALFRGNGAYGLSDFQIGPEGALYVVGYNAANFASSNNTRISRIEYAGACTSKVVSAYRSPEQKRATLTQGFFWAPGAGTLAWPEGMNRIEAFDVRGKKVFSQGRSSAQSEVSVPGNLGAGLLRVRFSP